MTLPAHTSQAMWNFWLKFKKKEPTVKLGGTFAPKPGYHSYRDRLVGWDYSKDEFADDRLGSGQLASAIDLTMPQTQMKIYSARLLKSGKDMKDPRGNYLREFFGTTNGTTVTGWDFKKLSYTSSDNSHLWHIHVSILRRYAADPKAYDALYSILTNESVLAWKIRNGIKTAVSAVVAKVTPAKLQRVWPSYCKTDAHVIGLITGPATCHGGANDAERADVYHVQLRLQQLGYAPKTTGWADGKFEAATETAVKKWQTATKHTATGYVDHGAWIRLFTY